VQTMIRMASAPRESLVRNIGAMAPRLQGHYPIGSHSRFIVNIWGRRPATAGLRLKCPKRMALPIVWKAHGS
jgi:hypothetical protein